MPGSLIMWRTLPYGLVFGLCLFSLVQWCLWPRWSGWLPDELHSTLQHGQPVELLPLTKFDPFDPSLPSVQDPHPSLSLLADCTATANPTTFHRRLTTAHHLNISLVTPGSPPIYDERHFNPTFLRLPSWAVNSPAAKGAKYVLVTRRVTTGFHQESLICLADLCLPQSASSSSLSPDIRTCNASDHALLGPHGGLGCTTPPVRLDIPPTPALRCSGRWSSFPYFPGFHDPRIFWSNRGEPLLIVNSASQYGCLGLWLLDLRTVYAELATVLLRDGKRKSWQSPVIRYRHLTELTRQDRSEVEKNWMLFFPGGSSSGRKDDEGNMVVQYDVAPRYDLLSSVRDLSNITFSSSGRALSLLYSNTGITITPNLSSSSMEEQPQQQPKAQQICFPPSSVFDSLGQRGHWHQSTNTLKLILCTRSQFRDGACGPRHDWLSSGREVHFSIIHRKFSNVLNLPMRYERYAVVWEGRRPWRMLGVSQWPVLFAGEVAQPWTRQENEMDDDHTQKTSSNTVMDWLWRRYHDVSQHQHDQDQPRHQQNKQQDAETSEEQEQEETSSTYFTYTPSIAWTWRPAADHSDAGGDHVDGQNDGTVRSEQQDIAELERLGMGFLGDDLLVGIGLDDTAQAMVRVKVDDLLGCLRFCQE